MYLYIKNGYYKEIFFYFFILSFPRLLISSSIWERPELWACIGFLIKNKRSKYAGKTNIEKYYF